MQNDTIVKTSHQFYSAKKTRKDTHKTQKLPFSPTGSSKKLVLLNRKPHKKKRKTEKNLHFLSKHVCGKSHSAKNTKEGTLCGFFNIHFVAKYQKMKGDSSETFRKSLKNTKKGKVSVFKKWEGGTLLL